MLKRGDSGPAVKALQEQLLALGYDLPRWGADGQLGQETLTAVSALLAAHRADQPGVALEDEVVSDEELALISKLEADRSAPWPINLFDYQSNHPGQHRIKRRPWSKITGITLHQTACLLGERPERWYGVPVQVGVTRQGKILLLNGLEWLTYHGNGFNSSDVGIEIDGHYAGIEGDLKTYWRPAADPDRQPLTLEAKQAVAARQAIRWICAEVARQGGKIRYLHAHRQSSKDRRSDPGSRIWQEVALPCMAELGLSDGGERYVVGSGLPIPQAWDPARSATY